MDRPRRRLIVALACVSVVWPAIGLAQPTPVGPEFQVNTYTTGDQGLFKGPSVAADSAGNFVVVWQRESYGGTVARRYASDGTPLGPEFVVNGDGYYPYPEYQHARNPSVASDASGNFVVAWESYDCEGYGGVCARRFDSGGTALGPEFKVDGVAYYGYNPKVAADADGDFVVVWVEYQSSIPVVARRFDGSGAALGAQFQVNTYTTGCCGYSIVDEDFDSVEVASDASGGFMVIWNRDSPATPGVFGRVYDSAGAPQGAEFQVNTNPTDNYVTLGIDGDGMGRFVAAWEGGDDIRGQRFDGTGAPLGSEFQVSTTASYRNFGPDVAADAAGGFVVVWSGLDSDEQGVLGQQFDAAGAPVGGEFQINTFTTEDQDRASVATGDGGNFVVTWKSYYVDGDGEGIVGQRLVSGSSPVLACSPSPRVGCRQSTRARKGTLLLKDRTPDTKDILTWKWLRGGETELADYGDPTPDGGTDYVLCVYDDSAAAQPRLQARAPAGGDCPGRRCWRRFADKRFEYKDADLDPDGLRLVRLQRGGFARSKITVRGKRENLDMPALPLTVPVVAQLQGEHGQCWENIYSDFVLRNHATQFKAKPNAPITPPTLPTTTTTTIVTTTTTVIPTTTTTTMPSLCGNNMVDGAEECDGTAAGACTGVCSPACECTCGLAYALDVAVSPDGAHVYTAANDLTEESEGGAVAAFSRNATTGELDFIEAQFDDTAGVDGIQGAAAVAVSPDGAHVYVAAAFEDAVAVFSRNVGTGALTFVEAERDGVAGVDGLARASGVAVSPDGAHVYVAGTDDNAVAVFGRNGTTGALTFVESVGGLGNAGTIAFSADGAHVYVAATNSVFNSGNWLAVFSRNATTGELTLVETLGDGVGGVDGLQGATSPAVSPDGAHVYVAGALEDEVAVFSRDGVTGALTFGSVVAAPYPTSITVSADGAHVYVTGLFTGTLSAFSRNAVTGALTLIESEADGVALVSVAGSLDGDHVYAADVYGTAVIAFSRNAGTGEVTLIESVVDGPDCAASPSGAFLELSADLLGSP